MIYIAGPYTGHTFPNVEMNIQKAKDAALWCTEHRIPFFCPHTHTAHFETLLPQIEIEFFYNLDMKFASICNALLLVDKWEYSKGCTKEVEYFNLFKLPIFRFPDQKELILAWWKFELNEKGKEEI